MLKSKSKKHFNFYGTIELRQLVLAKETLILSVSFGGQLETLVGSFDKNLNPFYDILKKTLGKD